MEFRKTEKSNLENKKFIFTLAGALLILSVTYAGFNMKSFIDKSFDFQMEVTDDLAELPPVTTPPPPPPPPPPPSKPPVEPELEIVEDEVELEEPEFEDDIEDMEISMEAIEETGEEEVVEDVPLTFTKDMPYFPECADLGSNMERNNCTRKLLNQKIRENFVMPEIAREMGYSGTVFVKFVVSKTGDVTQIEVLKGVNDVLDKAAIEAVKKVPRMVPGKNLDKPASIIYQVPVRISVN
jgi:protein TonB